MLAMQTLVMLPIAPAVPTGQLVGAGDIERARSPRKGDDRAVPAHEPQSREILRMARSDGTGTGQWETVEFFARRAWSVSAQSNGCYADEDDRTASLGVTFRIVAIARDCIRVLTFHPSRCGVPLLARLRAQMGRSFMGSRRYLAPTTGSTRCVSIAVSSADARPPASAGR